MNCITPCEAGQNYQSPFNHYYGMVIYFKKILRYKNNRGLRLYYFCMQTRLILVHIYGKRLIREIQSTFGEGLINSLVHIEINTPIVFLCSPHTNNDIY